MEASQRNLDKHVIFTGGDEHSPCRFAEINYNDISKKRGTSLLKYDNILFAFRTMRCGRPYNEDRLLTKITEQVEIHFIFDGHGSNFMSNYCMEFFD